MASIRLEEVNKYYYSGKQLIHAVMDMNLTIQNGEIVSILGPSGCGKSSTMRMIAGLEQITEGNVYVDDVIVNNHTPAERNVALAFESYALYQHLTVKENISFCLKVKGCSVPEMEKQVSWISELLGIGPLLDHKPSGLSGGQQQLVSLARALIRQPSITLLDEPISHLDTKSRMAISLKIRQIHNETGLTMAYVTHNQEEALALADRIAVMNFGELQQVGPRIEILEKPKNVFVADFVGEPSINLLPCSVLPGDTEGLRLSSGDGSFSISLSRAQENLIKENNLDSVILGLRPIDLYDKSNDSISQKITGEVQYFEFLGETGIIKIKVGSETLIVAVVSPDFKGARDDTVSLYFDIGKVHLFHPDTTVRLGD